MADGNFFNQNRKRPNDDDGAIPIWHAKLAKANGLPLPTMANALVIFANDQELAGMLAFNELSNRPVLMRPPPETEGVGCPGPFPRAWEEADRAFVLAHLQRSYNPRFKMETVISAMAGAAVSNRFHPVRDYLDSLRWDGCPRIGTWLTDAFGAPQDPYHFAVGMKFLQAAVRRVRRPGCKFDAVMVLEGEQEIGKSLACRTLFGDEWFTDNLPADLTGRHMSDALQGIWAAEFAEIEHLLRSEPEAIKAFLSRQVDRYIAPYGRMTIERPRQCIFIGTTNSDDYARDATGNRRLWPVRCDFVDASWVAENRDQLWAEAAATEPEAKLWLDDEETRKEAREHQQARREEDPWEDELLAYALSQGGSVTIPQLLTDHLRLTKDKQDKRTQMRVGKILRIAGWKRQLDRGSGKPGRRWLPPGAEVVTR